MGDMVSIMQQFGLAGGILFVFYTLMRQVVDHFIHTVEQKDAQMKQVTDTFMTTINVHMLRTSETVDRLDRTLEKNTQAVDRLNML
jgi:hypothetical protein